MMMKTYMPLVLRSFVYACLFVLGFSCSQDKRFNPDISDENYSILLARFDIDFYTHRASTNEDIAAMQDQYPDFYRFYNEELMGFGYLSSVEHVSSVKAYLADSVYGEAYRTSLATFKDTEKLEEELTQAFKRFHVLFPSLDTPRLLTYISGFQSAIGLYKDIIAISLDHYLGADHKYYNQLGTHAYMKINKHPGRIAPECVFTWIDYTLPYVGKNERLIDQIFYEGKKMVLARVLLPEVKETHLYGFTEDQLQWCKENTEEMWHYLLSKEHLYSSSKTVKNQYLGQGPFTSFFDTKRSPARAVVWLGEQYVYHFMRNNPEVSMQALFALDDVQYIMQKSGYRP